MRCIVRCSDLISSGTVAYMQQGGRWAGTGGEVRGCLVGWVGRCAEEMRWAAREGSGRGGIRPSRDPALYKVRPHLLLEHVLQVVAIRLHAPHIHTRRVVHAGFRAHISDGVITLTQLTAKKAPATHSQSSRLARLKVDSTRFVRPAHAPGAACTRPSHDHLVSPLGLQRLQERLAKFLGARAIRAQVRPRVITMHIRVEG